MIRGGGCVQTVGAVLKKHEENLRDAWFDCMLNAYEESTRRYFGRVNKEFANPVGANLYQSLAAILHELMKEEPSAEIIYAEMQVVLRIKAVQEVLPSQAVSFIPAFKQIINRECAIEIKNGILDFQALIQFYEFLDTIALYAFDIYVESRELIYEMRIAQIKETNDILVRAQLLDQSLDMDDFMQCASSADSTGSSCGGRCTSCGDSDTEQLDIEKGV